jgi:phosphoserine aminotransferase
VRPFNFSPGPATLPEEVLEQARDELLDWQGSGASVMEVSHRGAAFSACAAEAEADLRALMSIPADYRVLFLQGGATGQFAAIPLNLATADSVADYVDTGHWSKRAMQEARRYCRVHVAANAADSHYGSVPALAGWRCTPGAAYLHYTPNETIGGLEFPFVPDVAVPLVADMSSMILSRPVDVRRYGLIYASAQKNLGPAGLCVVIVHQDLLGRPGTRAPAILDYRFMADDHSMGNTPPTFTWYLTGLVLKWLRRQGGVPRIAELNRAKAARLYRAIDASEFYSNRIEPDCRSWMNVPFTLARPELDSLFVDEAARAGLINLRGHRSVGGMRASLYNAMPIAGVDALVAFMDDFARRHH